MEIQGRRRSSNFEDRGRGSGGGAAGIPIHALGALVRLLGVKGTLAVGAVAAGVFFFLPAGLKGQLLGLVAGGGQQTTAGAGSACKASQQNAQACDFSRVVLASTEDVWTPIFAENRLPGYGAPPQAYAHPTLVVFADAVSTGGCGHATSDVGPFYCPADKRLYIDPSFYDVMKSKLRVPGDFAQAYVIAHEVGHHVQNLLGSSRLSVDGESKNQVSVRVELQADCFAGVWGHSARSTLQINDEDLKEALTAAHAIGDDALGHSDKSQFTHGSSEQRIRWFRRGFEGGDARKCDTFGVRNPAQL